MFGACLATFPTFFFGKYIAKIEMKSFKVCTLDKPTESCVALTENGKKVALGKIIASSDKYTALYNNGKTTVYSSKDYDIAILNPAK